MAYKHILVPVDFSESSRHALELGIELATTFKASLTLIHVWEIPTYPYMELVPTNIDYLTPVENAAKAKLAETVAEIEARLPGVKSLLKVGNPWEQILTAIAGHGIDLVVMGTHGRRGLSHVLLGSVAEKIVRLSPVPVLTAHSATTRAQELSPTSKAP